MKKQRLGRGDGRKEGIKWGMVNGIKCYRTLKVE